MSLKWRVSEAHCLQKSGTDHLPALEEGPFVPVDTFRLAFYNKSIINLSK